jgi:hypothetical protein
MALVPLMAAIHGALDEHRYCSEHKAIEDIAQGDAAAPPPPDATAFASLPADSSGEDHAVCPFAGKAARADGPSLALPPCAPAPRAALPPLAIGRVFTPPVPLLRAAPKQSPPASIA